MTPATDPTGRSLLVVVAHPDDETFGTGSVLLQAAGEGARTVVVCATRGEAGEVRDGVAVPDGGVGALREGELQAAADALGVERVEVLDFVDSGMDGDPAAGTLCAADPGQVVTAVRGALDRHRPDVVVTLAADDGHRDHAVGRDAVLAAVDADAAQRGAPPVRVLLHCLPRSLMHAWVRHQAGNDKAAAYVELPEIGTPDDELTTVVDTATHYRTRTAAIALHASQSSPFDGLPDELHRAFLGTDHLVRARPAWDGGGQESTLWG